MGKDGEKKGKEGKRNRKGKEGRKEEGIKKRKKDRKEEGIKKKKKSSAGFKLGRSVLLVFLSVKREEVGGGIGFTFLPS